MTYFNKVSTKCLFCKKKCVPDQNVSTSGLPQENAEDGSLPSAEMERVSSSICSEPAECHKSSESNARDCSCYQSPVPFMGATLHEWENIEAFRENLKYAFLLRKLLDYPKQTCIKYFKYQYQLLLSSEDASKDLDGWFSVCKQCTGIVTEGHAIYHEIEKRTLQLDNLKKRLKNLITGEEKDGEVDDCDENEEEEGATIYTEVRDYFLPDVRSGPKDEGFNQVVKMEIETSLPFLEDEDGDGMVDDYAAMDNIDEGSDWAPSDEEFYAKEAIDVKPNLADLCGDVETDKGKGDENENSQEQDSSEAALVEKTLTKMLRPGPKSRKILRSTRSSKRLIIESESEEMGEDNEHESEDAEGTTLLEEENDTKKDSKKRRIKSKSILSDSESESMSDSAQSDSWQSLDSDYGNGNKKESFTCGICNAVYQTKHRLKDHERLHSSKDSFKCTMCPFVAGTSRGLSMHTNKIHDKVKKKVSKSRRDRSSSGSPPPPKKKIPTKQHKAGDNVCSYCPVSFKTAHRLREHEEQHLNITEDMLKCQHCSYICLLERGMKIHVTKYHSESERHVEPEEEIGFEDSSSIKDMSYTCKSCGMIYKTLHRLREHKNLHLSDDAVRCSECPCVFKTKRHLHYHMSSEHGIKPPKNKYRSKKRIRKPRTYKTEAQHCTLCPAKYYTNHRFNQHVRLHTSDANFPCEECGWVFSCSDKRDYHMKLSHQRKDIKIKSVPKTYQCTFCEVDPFALRYKFREHLLLNHADKVFHCTTCDQIYESKQLYDLHITKCEKAEESDDDDVDDDDCSDGSKQFACSQCKSKYKTKDLLKKHVALRHSSEKFPCSLCTIVFPTESRLRYHMARSHDKVQNICKICNYKAHGASHLRLHMQKHTKERLFSCELCGKTFVSPTYLTGHKQMEHFKELGLDPIKCEECDMLFPSASILKYHNQKVHEKKFKYFCELCGKGFLFASGLKHHSAIHSTERTEICQFCGAAYVHNRVLMEHLKKHHPEEYAAVKGVDLKTIKKSPGMNLDGPFICKFCNMEFPSRWSLHTHLKSHTEVYDKYKCGICGKGYSSPAGVKRHEETAHGATTFACQYCGKPFPCKDYLRYHVKNHCPKRDAGESDVKSDNEAAAPSTSKRQRRQAADIKYDPHIIKEAGQLHIVTPSAAASTSSSNIYHQNSISQQITYSHALAQPGSGASSSSSYAGTSQQPQHPVQQHHHLNDEATVNSLYRSYFSQHGFHSK